MSPETEPQAEMAQEPIDGAKVLEMLEREIHHQIEVRPYTTLAVAAAAGYVLGGGLPDWAMRLAWTVGSRVAMGRVASMVGGALGAE